MAETAARVVVGVDSSPESREAVRWAAQHAQMLGVGLTIVHAYRPPLAYRGTGVEPGEAAPELQAHAEALLAGLQQDLEPQLSSITTEVEIAAGERPADALIARSAGATALVLGAHGEGGVLGGFPLGSVTLHCMQHAACPVVVVRGPDSPHTRGQ